RGQIADRRHPAPRIPMAEPRQEQGHVDREPRLAGGLRHVHGFLHAAAAAGPAPQPAAAPMLGWPARNQEPRNSMRATPTSLHLRIASLERVRPVRIVLLLLGLQVALHLRWIDLPPSGFHAWRQTQTLSIARNYA